MKTSIQIILKNYLIGISALSLGAWIIGEIPNWNSIKNELFQWVVTFLTIPIISVFFSWITRIRLNKTAQNIYPYSVILLFVSWMTALYIKALFIGIYLTIESGQEKVIESIVGYTIYQSWIYCIIGIIHGLLGGILLSKDLIKNLESK